MAIIVLLEEEALTSRAIVFSVLAFSLTVGEGLLSVAGLPVRSVDWVHVADTVVLSTSIGKRDLVVSWSMKSKVDIWVTGEIWVLSHNADLSICISRLWNPHIVSINSEVTITINAPWMSDVSVHCQSLMGTDGSIRNLVSAVVVPVESHSVIT